MVVKHNFGVKTGTSTVVINICLCNCFQLSSDTSLLQVISICNLCTGYAKITHCWPIKMYFYSAWTKLMSYLDMSIIFEQMSYLYDIYDQFWQKDISITQKKTLVSNASQMKPFPPCNEATKYLHEKCIYILKTIQIRPVQSCKQDLTFSNLLWWSFWLLATCWDFIFTWSAFGYLLWW